MKIIVNVMLFLIVTAACQAAILEDFDSYADTAAMIAGAEPYIYTQYDNTMAVELDTVEFQAGSASAHYTYGGYPPYANFGFHYSSPIDLSAYDTLRIWYKGSSSNPASAVETKMRIADQFATRFYEEVITGEYSQNDGWNSIDIEIGTEAAWQTVGYIYFTDYKDNYGTSNFWIDSVELIGVPEPTSMVLLGLGSLVFAKRRR
jgi:PEP-CTERM motif-containing protein